MCGSGTLFNNLIEKEDIELLKSVPSYTHFTRSLAEIKADILALEASSLELEKTVLED